MKFKCLNGVAIPACNESFKVMGEQENGAQIELHLGDKDPGSVNLLRTWRMWMAETATWMCHRGCTMPLFIDAKGIPHGSRPYNGDDAHEQFTSIYLGTDENGKRKSWTRSKNKSDAVQASIGDRLWAMDQHLAYMTEKGCKLTIPRKSEYHKLQREQLAA